MMGVLFLFSPPSVSLSPYPLPLYLSISLSPTGHGVFSVYRSLVYVRLVGLERPDACDAFLLVLELFALSLFVCAPSV
jgi:hypothetical protein